MTPTLLALSRAYLALPGAPVHAPGDDGWYFRTLDGHAIRRAADGLLWLSDPDQSGTTAPPAARYVLDLTDAGTGGVLAAAWAAAGGSVWIGPKSDGWCARAPGASILDEPTGCGATLAEAVARAAVALGRAS